MRTTGKKKNENRKSNARKQTNVENEEDKIVNVNYSTAFHVKVITRCEIIITRIVDFDCKLSLHSRTHVIISEVPKKTKENIKKKRNEERNL